MPMLVKGRPVDFAPSPWKIASRQTCDALVRWAQLVTRHKFVNVSRKSSMMSRLWLHIILFSACVADPYSQKCIGFLHTCSWSLPQWLHKPVGCTNLLFFYYLPLNARTKRLESYDKHKGSIVHQTQIPWNCHYVALGHELPYSERSINQQLIYCDETASWSQAPWFLVFPALSVWRNWRCPQIHSFCSFANHLAQRKTLVKPLVLWYIQLSIH